MFTQNLSENHALITKWKSNWRTVKFLDKRAKKVEVKCPSKAEINKMWSIHPVEYYSAIKRKKALTHATMWMNLQKHHAD